MRGDVGFADFMARYPRGEKMRAAEDEFEELEGHDRAAVCKAVEAQLKWPLGTGLNLEDPTKVPFAANWLADERWRDKPPSVSSTGRTQVRIVRDDDGNPKTDGEGNVLIERIADTPSR